MILLDRKSIIDHRFIESLKWAAGGLPIVLTWLILTAPAGADTLQDYINEALQSNLALQQKNFDYEKSRAELAEARGAFWPSIDVSSRYSRADGGRTIDAPVGDLVNPIYSTLNQLLGENRFPTNVPNLREPFLREKDQETKITLSQPIFQAEIFFNERSRANMSKAAGAARDQYARQLVAEVKKAYFNYVKTVQVVKLLEQTGVLLDENLRVSKALVANEKATADIIYRAKAELSRLDQQQAEAERMRNLAQAGFNFLLNRPLTSPIDLTDEAVTIEPLPDPGEVERKAVEDRDELRQLQYTQKGVGDLVNLSKSAYLPGVFMAFDYGFQGEQYRFDGDHDYWMASVIFKWNLFNGFSKHSRVRQFDLERRAIQAQMDEVRSQIGLEALSAHQAAEVAVRSVKAAADRLESARKSFNIVERKFAEGMAPQIEYLDARTTLTEAEINQINTEQDYRIALAELERVTAGYPLDTRRFDRE
jgi:outer membrane protein